jgi:hypothetical protein
VALAVLALLVTAALVKTPTATDQWVALAALASSELAALADKATPTATQQFQTLAHKTAKAAQSGHLISSF